MRDSLIELLKNATTETEVLDNHGNTKGTKPLPLVAKYCAEILADFLISHGVTFAEDNNVRGKGLVNLATIKKAIKPKADSTLNNMKKADLIDYIRCLENNYNTAVWFNENQARYVESLNLPKWIPVSERLPNDGEAVLLYDKNFGLIDIGTYFKVGSRGSRKQTPRFVIMGSKHPIDDYTHWMPMPAPPEGDSSP